MFCKSNVLIDKKDEYLFVKIEKSYLRWDWINSKRNDIRFIWLIDFFGLRRFARSDKSDFWNWEFENDCSCRRSRNVNFNNIGSACSDWEAFNEIIIKKKHLFENSLSISYFWSSNQQRESPFKSMQKDQNKFCCENAWNRSKCKQ